MADSPDDQDYFGGLGQALLVNHGTLPVPSTGLAAGLMQGMASNPSLVPIQPPAGHLLGHVPTFAPPALGDAVVPAGTPMPGNADAVSQQIGQDLIEAQRPDIGGWSLVRDRLPRGFTRDMFDNYMRGKGDFELSPDRFQDIVNAAARLPKPPSKPVSVSGPNGEPLQRLTYDFSGSPDYALSLGSASLFYDQAGKPVGFYDDYNFDPAISKRSLLHDVETRAMHAARPFLPQAAAPFEIRYGLYARPQ